ncbi:ribosomal maturation YjgA family protein [Cellulomonas soli]
MPDQPVRPERSAVPVAANALTPPAAAPPARRRGPLLVAVGATLVAGVATTRIPEASGTLAVLGDAAGDALYAVLVWLVLALLAPGARTRTLTAVAVGLCALVELAQLTGGPATVVSAFPPARYLLGTTFVATDLLAYAVGCLAAAVLDRRLPRHAHGSGVNAPR